MHLTTRTHDLWAGTILLIVAAYMRIAWSGDWSVAILVVAGIVCILVSFTPEDGKT